VNCWAPAESHIRIEYPAKALGQLRERSDSGILFGARSNEKTLRIVAARRETDKPDPQLARFDRIGIYSVRARGEIFLTESDLQRFTDMNGTVALVVAGTKAGFFVREADGTIQAVRSYQEFPVVRDLPRTRRHRAWIGALMLTASLLAARPLFRTPPDSLTVRRQAGRLQIGWNPAAVGRQTELDVIDGSRETLLAIQPPLRSVTYVPLAAESDVRVFLLRDHTQAGLETALVLGNAAATPGP
jgi:hypothetical protein